MSLRRFGVLVRALPVEARMRFEKHGGWTRTDHLLTTNAELLHAAYCTLLQLGGVRNVPKPLKLPRPTDPKPKTVTLREWARMFRRR